MVQQILAIAESNPDGFTIKLPGLESVTAGIVAAYLETQDSFGTPGLLTVIRHALAHDKTMGGWLNEENGLFYFDSVRVFDSREEAIEFGRANRQLAIYDLTRRELIKL